MAGHVRATAVMQNKVSSRALSISFIQSEDLVLTLRVGFPSSVKPLIDTLVGFMVTLNLVKKTAKIKQNPCFLSPVFSRSRDPDQQPYEVPNKQSSAPRRAPNMETWEGISGIYLGLVLVVR